MNIFPSKHQISLFMIWNTYSFFSIQVCNCNPFYIVYIVYIFLILSYFTKQYYYHITNTFTVSTLFIRLFVILYHLWYIEHWITFFWYSIVYIKLIHCEINYFSVNINILQVHNGRRYSRDIKILQILLPQRIRSYLTLVISRNTLVF